MINLKAIIMAGGFGSRLLPVTSTIPKPMVKILGKPVMEYAVEKLALAGIKSIEVTLQHMPYEIIDYFGNGIKYSVKMNYHIEKEPLGTAGSVFDAIGKCNEDVLIVSGDALFDINLNKMIDYHKKNKAIVTMAVKSVSNPTEFGVMLMDNGRITQFIEKPEWPKVSSDMVNTGIYLFDKSIVKYDTKKRPLDFSKDVFPSVMKKREMIYGYDIKDSLWCDVGSPQDYHSSNLNMLKDNEGISKSAVISENVEIIMPCIIGDSTVIEENSKIGPNVYIGNNCNVSQNCTISDSVILDHVVIKNSCNIEGATILDDVMVNPNCWVQQGAVLGKNSYIENNVIVSPNSKIWPDIKIPQHSTIQKDVKSEGLSTLRMFSNGQITSELTLDEFVTLGIAMSSICNENNIVLICSEKEHPAANAFSAGLSNANIKHDILNIVPGYVFRKYVNNMKYRFGIYINNDDEGKLVVTIVNSSGRNITAVTSRKIKDAIKRGKLNYKASNDYSAAKAVKLSAKEYIKDNYSSHDLAVVGKSAKATYGQSFDKIKSFILSSNDKKEKRIKIKLKNSGLEYEIYLDGVLLSMADINRLNLGNEAFNDPFKVAVSLAKFVQKEHMSNKSTTATISQTMGCPAIKKGALMKSLYQQYGSNIYSENGVNIKYKKSKMRVIPHEYAPVIRVIAQGESEETLREETNTFVNEIKNTIS